MCVANESCWLFKRFMLLLKQTRYYLKFELHSLSLKINKCKDKRYEWRIFEFDVVESKGVKC